MASYKIDYISFDLGPFGDYDIPHGIKIYTSHREACDSSLLLSWISEGMSWMGNPWVEAAAYAISLQADYMGDLARRDNCKGLIIRFSFVLGVIWSIERRGFGPSVCSGPCTPSTDTGSSGGSGQDPFDEFQLPPWQNVHLR